MYNPRLSDPRRCFFCEDWAPRSLSIRRLALEQLVSEMGQKTLPLRAGDELSSPLDASGWLSLE
jgi:hypothetical protein